MKSFQIASAIIFATCSMAMAQEKVQISYSGVVSVEHATQSNYNEDYFYGNGDVSFRWSSINDVKFGADLGLESFSWVTNEPNYGVSAYYVAGIIEGRFGKISIGMPRGIMSSYFNFPKIGGSEFLNLEITFLGSDLFRYLKFVLDEEDGDIYGARYDGEIGKIRFAASAAKFSNYSGNIAEIVARYDAGQWSVTLGTTLYEADGYSANSSNLEVQGHVGNFSGGIVYNKLDQQLFGPDSFRLFASYNVNEAIKLNTQVMHYQIDGRSDSNIYSLDLAYKHKTGAFVNAGVITSQTWSDKIFNVSLGYKF